MRFSIIVPVYGVEEYIKKCIHSLKSQTFKDFECLIINDETKDNSVKVAIDAIGNDYRFSIYHKKNGGLSDARNHGLNFAKGEYVLFLDADDYLIPNALAEINNKIIKYNSDIVTFDLMYVYEDGRTEVSKGGTKEYSTYSENPDLININNSACNKAYRRSFIGDKRFIKGLWYEDLAVIPYWISLANNVSYVNKPLYMYIQREGSITHQANPKIFDIFTAITSMQSSMKKKPEEIFYYYYHCGLIATLLRIRTIDSKETRIEYYKKEKELMDTNCPKWYSLALKEKPEYKRVVLFTLLKCNLFSLLSRIF